MLRRQILHRFLELDLGRIDGGAHVHVLQCSIPKFSYQTARVDAKVQEAALLLHRSRIMLSNDVRNAIRLRNAMSMESDSCSCQSESCLASNTSR